MTDSDIRRYVGANVTVVYTDGNTVAGTIVYAYNDLMTGERTYILDWLNLGYCVVFTGDEVREITAKENKS